MQSVQLLEDFMKADAVSLLNDFIAKSAGTQFIIPVYQRNYT